MVDVVGMTPIDPLVVITSDDLDSPGHATETVEWVNPENVDERLAAWAIEWTDVPDNSTGRRFDP